jgi:chromosome segregation ATPase
MSEIINCPCIPLTKDRELAQLKALTEKLKAEIIDLKDVIKCYQDSSHRLRRERMQLQSASLDRDNLRAEITELTALNENQQSEINDLKRQVQDAKKLVNDAVFAGLKYQITPNAPADLLSKVENQRTEIKNLAAALEKERVQHRNASKHWNRECIRLYSHIEKLKEGKSKPDDKPFLLACGCPYCSNVAHCVLYEAQPYADHDDFMHRRVTYKCSGCKKEFVRLLPILCV